MTGSKLHRVIVAAASLAAGCTAGVDAQDAPVKAPPADEPVKPAAPRPAADEAMRALAEEVARLRAQLIDVRTAKAATQNAVAPQPLVEEEPEAPDPQPAGRIGMAQDEPAPPTQTVTERETIIEREVPVYVDREVPVYVDREVPVYVDREIIVEPAPTLVIERVVYGDECCDQWVPVRHVHSAGCGHHYYGCSCHPSYASLNSGVTLSFTYIDDDDHDDDHHHDGGHHDGHSRGGSRGHATPPRGSSDGAGGVVSTVPHRANSDAPRRPRSDRSDVATPRASETPPAAAGGERPPAAQPRRHQGDADAPRGTRTRDETASVATPPAAEAVPTRRADREREPGGRRERRADPPPPPPKQPRKQQKG